MNYDAELLEALKAIQAQVTAVSDEVCDLFEATSQTKERLYGAERKAQDLIRVLETRMESVRSKW